MPQFQLFPGARGLDFDGGGSLRADKHGRVNVDEATAQRIRTSSAMHRYDAIVEVRPGRFRPRPDDKVCACGFNPWPWQRECPRCGAELEKA